MIRCGTPPRLLEEELLRPWKVRTKGLWFCFGAALDRRCVTQVISCECQLWKRRYRDFKLVMSVIQTPFVKQFSMVRTAFSQASSILKLLPLGSSMHLPIQQHIGRCGKQPGALS